MPATTASSPKTNVFDTLVEDIRKAINLLDPQSGAVEAIALQFENVREDEAKRVWFAYDLYHKVGIALIRQLSTELVSKYEGCKATWPSAIFNNRFNTPTKPGRQIGWYGYVLDQVKSQARKFGEVHLNYVPKTQGDGIYLVADDKEALRRAVNNGLDLRDALNPEEGKLLTGLAKLAELENIITAKEAECRGKWNKNVFQRVFLTPKQGKEGGWLTGIKFSVGKMLSFSKKDKPDAGRLEKVIQNAEVLIATLDPTTPFGKCRCGAPLKNERFTHCDACHKDWQEKKDAEQGLVSQETDAVVKPQPKKKGSAKKRHSQYNGYKPKGGKKATGKVEDEEGFKASVKGEGKKTKKHFVPADADPAFSSDGAGKRQRDQARSDRRDGQSRR